MQRAFTLVELLVVVAIIVVLLALLVPAMQKAVYQAELASCGAKLKGTANVLAVYASEHRRYFPDRPGIRAGRLDWTRAILADFRQDFNFDDRVALKGYLSFNDSFNCPLLPKVDYTDIPDEYVAITAYDRWYGWRYSGRSGGMLKMGDRLDYGGGSFSVLASDRDMVQPTSFYSESGHPSFTGNIYAQTAPSGDNPGYKFARWIHVPSEREPIDNNYAFSDGAVLRYDAVRWDGEGNSGGFALLAAFSGYPDDIISSYVLAPKR